MAKRAEESKFSLILAMYISKKEVFRIFSLIFVSTFFLIRAGSAVANAPPSTPVLNGPGSGFIDVASNFSVQSTDPDADLIRYLWDWDGDGVHEETSGFVSSGSIFNISHIFSQAGNFTIGVKAQDTSDAESGWANFTIDISTANLAPSMGFIGNKTIDEGQRLSLSISASDPDNDTLTFSILDKPEGATFTQKSFEGNIFYLFEWTPSFEQSKDYSIRFSVEDGKGGADFEVITISVKDVDQKIDLTPPFISDIRVDPKENSATVLWSTNELATGKIEFGTSRDLLDRSTSFTSTPAKSSEIQLTSLDPGVLYHFRVVAKDEAGNTANSVSSTFVTLTTQIAEEIELRQELKEGSLLRMAGDERIFIIKNGKRVHVASPEVFRERGLDWGNVKEVSRSIFDGFSESSNLVRAKDDERVFHIINGKKRHIRSAKAFSDSGFDWAEVQEVTKSEIEVYPRLSLVRVAGEEKVYYITEGGLKKWIQNIDIFNSYNNKWEDVTIVSPTVLAQHDDVSLIKLSGTKKVYKLEGSVKRHIKTVAAFNSLGLDWNNIAPVNEAEFNFYEEGDAIE